MEFGRKTLEFVCKLIICLPSHKVLDGNSFVFRQDHSEDNTNTMKYSNKCVQVYHD